VPQAHLALQEALEVAGLRLALRGALEVAALRLPLQEVSGVAELPVLVVARSTESGVLDPIPQASRYSDSLFRQPLLLSFFVLNSGSVGVAQNT
jgi:hypothetical protein